MGDVWNIQDKQLTYGTHMTNGRHTEHSHFTVDILTEVDNLQGVPPI